ncbi:MAG TPA: hypothetical protein VD993_16495 [Chitinophagaceae bacterium]|nr:hypothetical protein [Chitinophagaceae bacterium]
MRKSLLALTVMLFCSVHAFTQLNMQYNFARPIGTQGENINQMHGLALGWEIKLKNSPFVVVPEMAFNLYGLKTLEQELPFHNGYVTRTDVNYTTSMNSYSVALKFQPPTKNNFQPFMAIRAGGLHYHSNMTIEDPEDPMGCRALEKKALVKDFTWMASGGVGFRLDGKAFSGRDSKVAIDFSAFYTHGGEAQYLKMSKGHDHSAGNPKSNQYYVKFEHIPSGEVHEHAIGTVYNTATRLLEFRLGVHIKLCN